jgi:bacterioferritin
MKEPFRADMELIRRRAREKMDEGAVTAAYKADRTQVIEVLNQVLATEIVCVLRYKNHYFMASGVHGDSVANEFLQHATEEQEHADQVARRIVQLGGAPDLDPRGLQTRAHAEYKVCDDLDEMIREDLAAERVAIATYSEIIRWLGDDDPTTRRMMEELLAKEEEHADELATLLEPTRRTAAAAQARPVPISSAASGDGRAGSRSSTGFTRGPGAS